MRTAILGGGIAGLAFRVFFKGRTTLFEKDSEVGGICKSLKKDGYTFDVSGSHVIFSSDAEVLNFEKEVLGGNIIFHKRNTKIYWKGKLVSYPFENDLASLGKEEAFECLVSYLKKVIEKNQLPEPNNFEEFAINSFGERIANNYLIPYNKKIWNIQPSLLNCDWIKGRVPQPPVEDIVKSAIGIKTEGYSANARFWYPKKGGFQAITNAIFERSQGEVRLNFEIKHVNRIGSQFRVSNGVEEFDFDRVVSSLPIPVLLKCIDNVPEDVKSAANNLNYNSVICVMLGLKGKHNQKISWIYAPFEEDGLFNRISFPSNYSPQNAPEGNSSILAEVTCKYEDDVWNVEKDKLIDQVINSLGKMGQLKKKDVVFKELHRERFGYIVYDLEHKKRLGVIMNFLKSYGIDLIGRFGNWEYWNSDKCIRSAIDKAAEMNRGLSGWT
jgi:protoporphyrinogen oxidase